jgi:hypothetical protein
MVQTLSKLHEQDFLWFGKKCKSVSDKVQAAMYKLTVTCSSHMNWISGLFLYTLYYIPVCPSAMNNISRNCGTFFFQKPLYKIHVSLKSDKELLKRATSLFIPVWPFVLICARLKQLCCHRTGFYDIV